MPEGDFTPNTDIISGQGIRLKKRSGINVLEPPFNLNVKKSDQILSVTSKDFEGVIVTTVYTVY